MDNQPVPPLIHQMFLTKAGLYCSERLSIDIVHLNQCINLLLPTFNEEEISKEYEKIFGEDSWNKIMKYRKKLNKKLAESKTFYDALQNKSLIKRGNPKSSPFDDSVQRTFKKFFSNTASKIFLMETKIYNLFVFLVSHSDIQRGQIKGEYFKNLEQNTRTMKSDKNKTGGS